MERTGAPKLTGCSNFWINWSVRYETFLSVYFEQLCSTLNTLPTKAEDRSRCLRFLLETGLNKINESDYKSENNEIP